MAFVPGFDYDVFISYAHGDDRLWINRFADRLKPALARLLPGADIWIDKDNLREHRNFAADIPAALEKSAVLISLVSPTYITRSYCVHEECRRFTALAAARKNPGNRFAASEFAADLFGFRCPILPIEGSAHWDHLIPGATDIAFCDDIDTFSPESPAFEEKFRGLLRLLRDLLRRMRNHSTPVLVYPYTPSPELMDAHGVLSRELNAQSYRVLPENELDPEPHAVACDLGVLILGANYEENHRRLAETFQQLGKSFVVWPSPAIEKSGSLEQRGFLQHLLQLESGRCTILDPAITPEKLKQEVLAILNPDARIPPAPEGRPRVYLVYDSRSHSEENRAGQIAFYYREEFQFERSDNARQHNLRLTQSEGVLVVWGDAAEEWCANEFDQMVRLAPQAKSRGLVLFDPKESKIAIAAKIRTLDTGFAVHVAEQFGPFNPDRLEPFFHPIRRDQRARA